MFETQTETVGTASTKNHVRWHGAPISMGSALDLCRTDDLFRSELMATLAALPFDAYFWETPPITTSLLARPFEFVVTNARGLAEASADLQAFRKHFGSDDDQDGVVVFENIGLDAMLVVPCPIGDAATYVHLAAFLRGAPEPQRHALFRCVANEALSRVSERPLWMSTAGMGVYWLHVRLDSRPKYYRYAPYKSPKR